MKSLARLLALAILLAPVATPTHAAKGAHVIDHVWTRPDFDPSKIQSIAMLPVATFDGNLEAERLVQMKWGQTFAGAGYRWISGTTARDLIRGIGGDSLLRAVKAGVLKGGQVDSLSAPSLCARLRVNALLSVRVDLWAQSLIQPDQAGKPSTSLQLRAALVDSAGRLLWTASGSETAEGQYTEPSAADETRSGTAVTRSNGIGTQGAGAPAFAEVLDRLLVRWVKLFPARPAAAGVAAPAPASAADSLKPAPHQ